MTRGGGEHVWAFTGPEETESPFPHQPRLVTDEMMTLREAALDGVGIVVLPMFLVEDDLARGTLEALLPEWSPPRALVHAVFPSRRGLLPAVRAFIDVLSAAFAGEE
jgi:DNA-binding transcriptional LysR family regulator